eukprot:11209164-Lingulodinium_polyedra.AAC.1
MPGMRWQVGSVFAAAGARQRGACVAGASCFDRRGVVPAGVHTALTWQQGVWLGRRHPSGSARSVGRRHSHAA